MEVKDCKHEVISCVVVRGDKALLECDSCHAQYNEPTQWYFDKGVKLRKFGSDSMGEIDGGFVRLISDRGKVGIAQGMNEGNIIVRFKGGDYPTSAHRITGSERTALFAVAASDLQHIYGHRLLSERYTRHYATQSRNGAEVPES